jgi:PAS domain S-box-containing protein
VKYPLPLQVLHWVVALLVACQLTLALILQRLLSLQYGQMVLAIHRQMGMAILLCVLLRVALRLRYRAPPPSQVLPAWQKLAQTLMHRALFLLLLLQPLFGICIAWARGDSVSVFGLFALQQPFDISDEIRDQFTYAHSVTATVMVVLVAVHLAAVLFNRFVRREFVMDRILPSTPAHHFVNRVPIAVQLLCAFGLVLCVALGSGIHGAMTYREFSRISAAYEANELAAGADMQMAQLAWKELVGLAISSRPGGAEPRIEELLDQARSSLDSAAHRSNEPAIESGLTALRARLSTTESPMTWLTPASAHAVDLQLQDLVDAQRATAFQAQTDNTERIARGHDLIVLAIVPMALLGLVLALVLARSIAGAVGRMRRLVRSVGAGDVSISTRVVGQGGFATLMRDMVAMRAAVERESAKAAEHYRELFGRLQKITSQVPGVVYQYRRRPDGTAHFPYASDGIRQIYGLEPEAVSEDAGPMFAVLHPQDRERVRDGIAASAAQSIPWRDEFRVCHADGGERWVSGSAQPESKADGSVLWHGFAADVTERRLAAQEIASAHIQLQSVLDAATETSIIATDLNGVITMFSAGAVRLLGYTSEEMVGRRNLLFIHLQDELERRSEELAAELGRPLEGLDILLHAVRDGSHEMRDWSYIRKNGSALLVSLHITAVCDADDRANGFLAVATDITKRRLMHETLQAAKEAAEAASRAKSDFLANMSHEIRTPLNGIIGMTGLLLDTPLRDDQREFAGIVRSSGESLLAVLNDVLDFSKIEAGQMALEQIDFDLLSVIEQSVDAVAIHAQEKGLELIIDADTALPQRMRGDPTRLRQVLLNLLSNAVKFTVQGEVRLSARRLQTADGRSRLRVDVVDTGPGLTEVQRARLFLPFIQADTSMTRRFGGTGLGLSICRRLVELMNGSIGIDSIPESGSCFWFEIDLPAVEPSATADDRANLDGCEILVIADHPVTRRVIDAQLASVGGRVTCVGTAAEAEVAWRQFVADHHVPGAIVLDYDLPDQSGRRLAQQLSRDPACIGVPMILMTSLGSRVRDPIDERAIDRIITKPVKRTALIRCVLEVLGKAPVASLVAQTAPSNALQGMRALVAEDNVVNQKLIHRILEKLGIDVTVVDHGAAAIAKLSTAAFEVVLMDCQMPVLDGYEATRRIRAGAAGSAAKSIPIVALTAHVLRGDRDRCLEAGMDHYLTKPINPAELRTLLRNLRGSEPRPGDAAAAADEAGSGSTVFDQAALKQRIGDDEEFLAELLNVFVGAISEHVVALLAAAVRGDAPTVAQHAHSIKGAAANVSADALARAAAELEQAARKGVIDARKVEAVHAVWRDTQQHPAIEPIVAGIRRAG